MNVTDNTMQSLVFARLEYLADRVCYHYDNGDDDLAQLLHQQAMALAAALDEEETVLVAEALF